MEDSYYKKYEPLFGSWYIKEKIGQGAYGKVYIIERKELGITYRSALKAITIPQDKSEIKSVMSDGMTREEATQYYESIVKNVVKEFTLMSRLKGNSHIVSYEDHVMIEHEDDIGWDILMRIELLTPLLEHTYRNDVSEADIVKLGIDLCKALELCRKYNIIHRDIKPENIFIAESGDYKLGDFGIAKRVEHTRLGLSRKGTYAYMAPEVYVEGAYGPTVDIYSLGIVMYKFLNDGRTPFMPAYPNPILPEDREKAFSERFGKAPVPEPKNGSPKLKKIILKACEYHAGDRYQSAEEFREELESFFYKNKDACSRNIIWEARGDSEEPGAALKKKNTQKTSVSVRRKKLISILCAAAVAVAGAVYALLPKGVESIEGIGDKEKIYIGESLSPDYKIEPKWLEDEKIKFKVSDNDVIDVDSSGIITAQSVGKSKLIITSKGYSRTVKIEVVPKIADIYGIDKKLEMEEGSSETLEPKLYPEKFSNEKITYTSLDPDIAEVGKTGTVRAKSPGITEIIISAGGLSERISIEVREYTAPAVYKQPAGSSYVDSGSSESSGSSGGLSGGGGGDYFDSAEDELF